MVEGELHGPERRKGDRASEINFRRLRAVATVLGDEDAGFLDDVAAQGVPLGVDMEMPRTPLVYEEKRKWTVDPTDEDFQDTLSHYLLQLRRTPPTLHARCSRRWKRAPS